MNHFPLPDLNQMTGVNDAEVPVTNETIDVSSHALAAAAADVWEMTPLQGKDGFGRAQGDIWFAEEWSLMDVHLPPVLFMMDERHAQAYGSLVAIERWIYGEEQGGGADGETYRASAGELNFLDQECHFQSAASQRRLQTIALPRALLGLCEETPVVLPSIEQTSAIGQLVFAEWDDLYADLNRGDARLSRGNMDRTVACLKIALGVNPQREDVRAHAREALFRHICRFIEANLENPDLSTGLILNQFGVSRATLYRMFEPLDGVRNYVTYRRATAALYFISQNQDRRGVVLEACERWGFSSPANFNRTIQRLFGNSPKALLNGERILKHGARLLSHYFRLTYNGEIEAGPDFAMG